MSAKREKPTSGMRGVGFRTQGFNDGLANRPIRFPDVPEYRTSYRRGQERRAQLSKEE